MKKIIRITTVPISLLILLRSQLRFMSDYYEVVAVSSGGTILEQVSKETGVRTVEINMTREITPFKDLKALWSLYWLMKRERPDIVHTHTPKAGLLGMIASKLAQVPVRLHTVAGMPLLEKRGFLRKILDLVEKLTYRCATKVYPNSRVMRDLIIDFKYCNPKKLKVIGNGSSNGIDTNYFNPDNYSNTHLVNQLRVDLNIDKIETVYCFIGRVVADKGVNELVNAFVNLQQNNLAIKLLIVGPFERHLDPLEPNTEEQIMNNPSIIWVDFQDDIRPYLCISDIFVFPSYREGFPNVVMQAGAMGLPCIVTNINGCNEIIIDGENGLIVPVKDVDALEGAMQNLTLNDPVRNLMKSKARDMIAKKYDQDYVLGQLLKEYLLVGGEEA